ncbi:extensin [Streptomyces longhuiensis]|uniref:extensin n=1 Tax=Streptomyces longhuiensis TaxID=2880933 RepID=UPI001D0AE59C|nr:extensin [Streptomyces longhuiensis]UDM03292.1 extensin [Streptomyces longhuiensis]
MSAPAPAEAQALLSALTRALAGVAVLALVFTAVNVTLFATSRGVAPAIAILLDPMVALALAAILYADARLAAWGIRPPRWSAALRWFTGITATLMNTWDSIWPDRQIGTPIHADPAGIVLHGVPTVLLILLTETIAAYRRTVAPLLDPITPTAPTPDPDPSGPMRSGEPVALSHPLRSPGPAPGEGTAAGGPHSADSPPATPPGSPAGLDRPVGAIDAALWAHAVAIDDAVRTATGRPASVWRLRSELHLGPDRAKQIHAQLLKHGPDGAPPLS